MSKPICDCHTAMAQLWDYLDEELTDERYEAVKEHLANCTHCLPHAQFAQGFLEALGRCRHAGQMPEGVRAAVMNALKKEGLV